MVNFKNKFIVAGLLILNFAGFAENSEKVKDENLSHFISVSNFLEVRIKGSAYTELTDSLTAEVGVDYKILDNLTIGGSISNFTYFLDGNPTSEKFKFSTYVYEDRLAGYFNLSYSPTDFFTFKSSVGIEGTFRPDDSDSAYRVGLGVLAGLDFNFSDYFLTFGLSNLTTPSFGIGNKNILMYNDFYFDLRFDVFNFIKNDINLGLFISAQLFAENYFSEANSMSGEATYLYNEIFTGFIYTYDFFETNFAVLMFNLLDEDKFFDAGLRLGFDFNFDKFGIGFAYKPHLYSKNITQDIVENTPKHMLDFAVKLNL